VHLSSQAAGVAINSLLRHAPLRRCFPLPFRVDADEFKSPDRRRSHQIAEAASTTTPHHRAHPEIFLMARAFIIHDQTIAAGIDAPQPPISAQIC
jgi:hypothetical protein